MLVKKLVDKFKFSIDKFYINIVAIYLVFGISWILFSDFLLNRYVSPGQHWLVETSKGLAFVLLSALVIYLATKHYIKKVNTEISNTKRLDNIINLSDNVVYITDLEGTVLYCSNAVLDTYRLSREQVIGKNLSEVVQFTENSLPEIYDLLKQQGYWRGKLKQTVLDHTSGEQEKVYESRFNLVVEEDGQECVLVITLDITDKEKFEAQIIRAQKMESIGVLSAGIAHDLNNVLQPISLSLELLRDEPTSNSKEMIDILQDSVRHGTELIKQMLSFSRNDQGDFTIVELKSLLKETVKVMNKTFPSSIKVESNISEDLWKIYADHTQIHQIIMNLCLNARDAMPEGGQLKIDAGNIEIDETYAGLNVDLTPGNYVLITVSDNGVGIPKRNLDKIFEPFYTTKEAGKGTGLGLSVVYNLVKRHGGFTNVYSEVGKGTRFKIYLPNADHQRVKDIEKNIASELPRGNGESVLVVDDDRTVLDITKKTLEKNGYKVITAVDGEEGVAVYTNRINEVDVVVMDIVMPNISGIIATKTLRRIDNNVKIILSSGFEELGNSQSQISNNEFDAKLSKPYTAEQLLKTINRVLKS